jgi:hypothetical protein
MANVKFSPQKVVSALPGTLTANTIYYVRVGLGYDTYVTNDIGTVVAYKANTDYTQALTGLTASTVAPVTADDSALVAFGKLQAQINYNPICTPVAGVKAAAYLSTSGEYFLLQNSIAQHTVRGMSASAGGSTTLASLNMMGANDFGVQGTATTPAKTGTNEWTQMPKTRYLNGTLGYIVYTRCLQPMHFINQNVALQYDAVNTWRFSVSETTLYNGARMFCGSKLGAVTPTDTAPEQMTDIIGLLQSPFFTANPNRLYFVINGNGVVAAAYDTGIDVAVGVGYQFSYSQSRNSPNIGFRLKVINTNVFVTREVDLTTVGASSRPGTGSYYPQLWRSTNGNTGGSLVGIDFGSFYNELGN